MSLKYFFVYLSSFHQKKNFVLIANSFFSFVLFPSSFPLKNHEKSKISTKIPKKRTIFFFLQLAAPPKSGMKQQPKKNLSNKMIKPLQTLFFDTIFYFISLFFLIFFFEETKKKKKISVPIHFQYYSPKLFLFSQPMFQI